MKISQRKILPIIKVALKEDIGRGDITTKLIVPPKKMIKAVIVAKEGAVVCGLEVAKIVFKTVDKKIRFLAAMREGKKVKRGTVLARLEGKACNILQAERVALNFLSRLSGIATKTFHYIQRTKSYPVKIMDTRKTTPGLRILEKYAVRCAGGFNHRMGLWEQVLIKDNHLQITNHKSSFDYAQGKQVTSLKDLIKEIKKKRPKGMKIEVEVTNLRQFEQALKAGPDIIMLDNFNIKDIKKAVKIREHSPFTIRRSPKIEVSGRVNLNNVRKIAASGVDIISVGELTHSINSIDISLEIL